MTYQDLAGSLAAARATPLVKWVACVLALGALGACGQKGALYMQPAAQPAPAAPASAPAQ